MGILIYLTIGFIVSGLFLCYNKEVQGWTARGSNFGYRIAAAYFGGLLLYPLLGLVLFCRKVAEEPVELEHPEFGVMGFKINRYYTNTDVDVHYLSGEQKANNYLKYISQIQSLCGEDEVDLPSLKQVLKCNPGEGGRYV